MKINFLKRKKEFGFTIEIIKEMKERVLFYVLQSLERLHVVEGTAGYPLQFVVMQKPEKPNKNMCMLMNHNNLLFIENQWGKHFFFFLKKKVHSIIEHQMKFQTVWEELTVVPETGRLRRSPDQDGRSGWNGDICR